MYSEEIQTKHRHEPILEVLKIAMMLPLAIWWSIDQWPMNYAAWFFSTLMYAIVLMGFVRLWLLRDP